MENGVEELNGEGERGLQSKKELNEGKMQGRRWMVIAIAQSPQDEQKIHALPHASTHKDDVTHWNCCTYALPSIFHQILAKNQ